jgi:hypothetical protein
MAKHISKTIQHQHQAVLAAEAKDMLRSMPLEEWLSVCRPADRNEETRYIRAWQIANAVKKPQPQLVPVHHEELPNFAFKNMAINFID